jgi:hypothetical protein
MATSPTGTLDTLAISAVTDASGQGNKEPESTTEKEDAPRNGPNDLKPPNPPDDPAVTPPASVPAGHPGAAPPAHAKKFAAVNISKKFLEKNASGQGSAPTTSHSALSKPGSPAREWPFSLRTSGF